MRSWLTEIVAHLKQAFLFRWKSFVLRQWIIILATKLYALREHTTFSSDSLTINCGITFSDVHMIRPKTTVLPFRDTSQYKTFRSKTLIKLICEHVTAASAK